MFFLTATYAVLHFLVDFTCACAMIGRFALGSAGYGYILIYNFSAFALQMPLGTLLDGTKRPDAPRLFALTGVICTFLGAFLHPALLGLGNALFHVGGGVDVIREDCGKGLKGRALGVFVAPGAMGLFFGTLEARSTGFLLAAGAAAALFARRLFRLRPPPVSCPSGSGGKDLWIPGICCFLVVALRSYVGMAVVFSWKTGFWLPFLAVCAVVLGKMAGGFAAARFGTKATVLISLGLAGGCYLLCDAPVFGLAALFFFNMSMPVTLYQLWLRMPAMPGLAFGALTFALFLGFVPVYLGLPVPVSPGMLGALGSAVSLGLLWPVCREVNAWTGC